MLMRCNNNRTEPVSEERVEELLAIVSATTSPYTAEDATTAADPVPLGVAGPVGAPWSVVVSSVDVNAGATGLDAGKAMVVANITATNVGDVEVLSFFSFEAVGAETVSEADPTNSIGPLARGGIMVSPGDSISGEIAFQVAADDVDDLIITIEELVARTPPTYFATQ